MYTNNGSHKGHNVSALELSDGSYVVVVSEIVPFTIYKSSSLDGPWTGMPALDPEPTASRPAPPRPAPAALATTPLDSNVSHRRATDGKFEIVQRHGFIAIADTLCGPYKMQKPTWTYPRPTPTSTASTRSGPRSQA